MTGFVPISRVEIDDATIEALVGVVRSGMLAQGPQVRRLEELFETIADTEHAVAVTSGTAALVLALQANGVGPGDEVITTPFTFVATLNAILACGAKALFVDIGDDFNMNAKLLEAAITERTRAILPVHLYGLPADMDELMPVARLQGITVIEDAAQAIGASVGSTPVGSFGTACFSLYATKNVTTGEGGVITTNSDEVARSARLLRNQGMVNRYEYEVVGFNHRMTDLQAVLGIRQLENLTSINDARRANAQTLTEGLDGIEGLWLPEVPLGRTHVFHQYTVRVTEDSRIPRDELAEELRSAGVGSGVYYPRPVFDYDVFRDHPGVIAGPVPNARQASDQVLSLPVHPSLTATELERVVAAVRGAMHA